MVTDLLILTQVLLIDVTLAGDNAVVVALAVLGLPARERRLAILFGIAAATIIRILFALLALRLLQIIGLTLAGGLLLLWVCWRMMREFSGQARLPAGEAAVGVPARPGHLRRVVLRIVLGRPLDEPGQRAGGGRGRQAACLDPGDRTRGFGGF